jgi:hypothetical protein
MKSAPARPAPKPAAKPAAKPKPVSTAKPATTSGTSSGTSSGSSLGKSGSSSSTSTLGKNKNGNSTFTKDPENTSKAEENQAKDKAKTFQEKFLESWGGEDTKADDAKDAKGESKSEESGEAKAEKKVDAGEKAEAGDRTEAGKKAEAGDKTEAGGKAEAGKESDPDSKSPDATSPDELKEQFSSGLQNMAQENPEALDQILEQSFDQATPEQLTKLRNDAAAGKIEMPANVSFVDPSKLNGSLAAYSPENKGTVLLSEQLKSNPTELRRAFAEEAGHHIDSQLGSKDSTGDEGQIFQEGLEAGRAVSPERAAELKAQNDKGTAEINGRQTAVENKDNERQMGPLTPEQMRQQEAQERQQVVETLTGDDVNAAYKQANELFKSAVNDPAALQTLMAGFDGADPHVQEFMLRGVQNLSAYAAKGGEDRQELMKASQGFFRHVMDAPQRLQEQIANNPLRNVGIAGQLPYGFNAQTAQGVMGTAMNGSPSDLANVARQMKFQGVKPIDHNGMFRDPRVGPALNQATQQVYDGVQRMPGTMDLAQKAAQSYEGTLSSDQMSAYLDDAKKNYYRGGHQGEQATAALARNVDQLSSSEIMRMRGSKPVLAAALKPGSDTRERLMQEAVEGNNPALKRFLTDQFSQGSMSDDRFKSLTDQVGSEFSGRVRDAMSKDPKELKGKEHLYAEYGNMLRAQQMYLSGGEHSEQVDYGQVMKRLEAVQRQLGPEVLEIQKSMSSYSSVHRQEDYLGSQDFQDRLKLADPTERADLARQELAKLNTFNPEAAEQLAPLIQEKLGVMQATEPSNGLALFQGQSEETQGQVVDGLVQASLSTAGGGAKTFSSGVNALDGKATKQIADILDGISPDEVKTTADLSKRFSEGLTGARSELEKLIAAGGEGAKDAKKALRSLDRVAQWANDVGEAGGWGAFGAALGTTSLALGGLPQNGTEAAGAATGVAGVLGNLDDTAKLGSKATRAIAEKLFKAGGNFDELAKMRGVAGMSKLMGKLKILGPVSDIAGGALDTYKAYQGADKGDVHETIGTSMSAAGGLGAGAGGVLMAAGLLSNPVGWTVIGVGTATALAGMGYQWAFGMDEQEEFLQSVGVRRDDW